MKKNLWERFEKTNCLSETAKLRLHVEHGIDPELRRKFIVLIKRLRKSYVFPIPLNIYVVNSEKVTLTSGEEAYGSFRWFQKRTPRIRIPAAYEKTEFEKYGKDELDVMILSSLIHELTHYFEYCSDSDNDKVVSERMANHYRYLIIEKLMPEL